MSATPPPSLTGLSAIKLALLARQARAQSQALLGADPIAIVGMACRVPGGGDTPELFWQLLRDGTDAVGTVPADRWNADAWFDADLAAGGKAVTKEGGFLKQIDGFDAGYFGIVPREAQRMDPQQRLFLEVAIEALDDAGQTREQLRGSRTGVFIASYHNDYAQQQYNDIDAIDARTLTGTLHSVLANRLSHFLDLRGPSISVDTACSSSLVATHLACQSLRFGESDLAVAGGVSLIIAPELFVSMSKVGFMAPDGRCKTFDAAANGFGRGEGCGIVVLKRLADAVADGDRVLAVVRGSAVNQDGHSTLLAAPSGPAQQALLRQALANAQLDAGRIGYIETHGTGTALGDPIEVEAIAATVGQAAPGAGPCVLGSAKANVGHLEAAAGVTGLIKAVLALRHEAIPPQVHFRQLSPHIHLEGTRLAIADRLLPWPKSAQPRCAGASSFGVGGTNAHVIVEEAPALPAAADDAGDTSRVLPLSAQTPQALQALLVRWRDFLAATPERAVDIAFTAAQRRSPLPCRAAVVGRGPTDWRSRIDELLQHDQPAAATRPGGGAPRVAFVFSGQGPQWFGMGRELLASEPVFREVLTQCDALLRPLAGWSLLDELAADESRSRVGETEVAQPALFALQTALVALWRSWGLRPDAVVGHSVGEIAALHAAGVLGLADALRVVCARGRTMQQATGGGRMAAVGLAAAQAAELVAPFGARLSVAAVNGPRSVVLSGEAEALQQALAQLAAGGTGHQMLPVNYAFHSAQMAPLQQQLVASLAGVRGDAPALPVYSTVTGALAAADLFDAAYFGRNVRETVQFAAAIDAMATDGFDVFVEIGPHPVLAGAIAENLAPHGAATTVLASLRRGRPERETLLQACAGAYAAGCSPDWSAVQPGQGDVVTLPAYPWQRERHWIRRLAPAAVGRAHGADAHPLLGTAVPLAGAQFAVFDGDAQAAQHWLADHRIFGRLLLPAAAVMEAFAVAARTAFDGAGAVLTDFAMERPLFLPEAGAAPARWQTQLRGPDDGRLQLELHEAVIDPQRGAPAWRRVATATALRAATQLATGGSVAMPDGHGGQSLDAAEVYAAFDALGVAFGPQFRRLDGIVRSEGSAQAWVQLAQEGEADAAHHLLQPALLDAALQLCSIAAAAGSAAVLPPRVMLPLGADRIEFFALPPTRLRVQVTLREASAASLRADLQLHSADGALVARIAGLRFAAAEASAFAQAAAGDALYTVDWQQQPAADAAALQSAAGHWLLLADAGGAAASLARALDAAGARCTLVHAEADADLGADAPKATPARRRIDARDADAWRRLLAELSSASGGLRGVVHLWSLDLAPFGRADQVAAEDEDGHALASALHLVQALADLPSPVALHFVTRGAQVLAVDAAASHDLRPRAAGVWGLAGVAAVEQPDWQVCRIDLDPAEPPTACAGLLPQLLAPAAAPRSIALRAGRAWAPRLQRLVPRARDAAAQAQQWVLAQPGTLDGAALRPLSRQPLAAGEVRLQVQAAGLNFRDVLLTLGMYPGAAVPLGAECAGIVTELAPDVRRWQVGDRVFGYAPASLATEVAVRADFLAAVPPSLSMHLAAALPVAFMTAMHGFGPLAGLQRGERVLVHAAAGGVGLAAVQLALRLGAEVFATAGSEAKRDMLRALGVAHVFDSRTLSFADEVLAATGGTGVQVVLNSLAGDFIGASLRCLAKGGRFLELGKRDILDPQALAAQRPDVAYHPYDLGTEAQARPGLLKPMFDELLAALADGSLQPLPVQTFALAQAPAAMRHMAQARHTGKIVLLPAQDGGADRVVAEASYLVTGGLGALGLATARWLVARGARHLVLTGRRAPDAAAQQVIDELQADGAHLRVEAVDTADAPAMQALFDDIAQSMPPLRGVVHAAGTLHDGVLTRQRWNEARAVLRGKAHGAWVLHNCTRSLPLDFFVLYSAAGQWLGAAGQGLYAAANAELDALALARRLAGLPALSVAWGAWAGGGMAAEAAVQGRDIWAARGLHRIEAQDGFAALQTLLRDGVASAAVLPIDWSRFGSSLPAGGDHSFFAAVLRPVATAAPAASRAAALLASLQALPAGQRRDGLRTQLALQVVQVLGLVPGTPLDARVPLKETGLDSLMAVELRNALAHAFGRPLPVTLLFDHPTLDALATHLTKLLGLDAEADADVAAPAAAEASAATQARADVQALSDAEAEALLLAELDAAPPGAPR